MRTYSKITVAIAAMALSLAAGCTANEPNTTTPVSPVGAAETGATFVEHKQGETWTANGVDYTVTWKHMPADPTTMKDYGVEGKPYLQVEISVNNHGAAPVSNPDGRLGMSVTINGEMLRNEIYAPSSGADVLPGNQGVFTVPMEDATGNMQIKITSADLMQAAYWTGTV